MIGPWLPWLALGSAMPEESPVRLVAERYGSRVALSVVGEAATTCDVTYVLQVENGRAGKSNRSVQRGTATLLPSQKSILARLSMNTASEGWTANLIVTSCDGKRYRVGYGG